MQYIELFKRPDGGGLDEEGSFTYASDYLEDQYDYDDTEYQYYTYDDEFEINMSEPWTDFCAHVLDDISYYFSFLFDDSSYSFTGGFGFYKDVVAGHGTWTAGCAAGSISASSTGTEATCYGDELPGCAGGCIASDEVDSMLENDVFNIDLYCPLYDCDDTTGVELSYCLSDDPVETLHQNIGVAPGAKISVFDVSYTGEDLLVRLAGNMVWESAMGTGAKIHSNS